MKRNSASLATYVALLVLVSLALPSAGPMSAYAEQSPVSARTNGHQVEPQAGTWQTWVLTSGSQLRLPSPPSRSETNAELRELRALAAGRDAAALDLITFWNAGPPGYRWNELAINTAFKTNMNQARVMRLLALIDVAIYDATVAAWDTKYAYTRARPSEIDHRLETALPTPASPAYPSEHAVAAGAASQVLAYTFPNEAQSFMDAANAAGHSRLLAGTDYPSDVSAGLTLGRAVADLVIARARTDGSDIAWTGSVPTEPGRWNGTNPFEPTLGSWKPWVLSSGSQFRPAAPPAPGSAQMATELAELKNYVHTPATDRAALYWQFPNNSAFPQIQFNFAQADKKVFEYHLDVNPPEAARVYALLGVSIFDSFVSCWDAKYFYWAPRPNMVDPSVKTLFANPPHPSYPSAHSCVTRAAMGILGALFPRDAATLLKYADEAGEARICAGIHFRSDVVAGLEIGRQVTALIAARVQPVTTALPLPNTGEVGDPLVFPETGYSLDGEFLAYWKANGGLPVFGFPIDSARLFGRQIGQWLERARFELHVENAAPYNVLLGRLGVEALDRQGRDWQTFAKAAPDAAHYYAATGHAIAQQFWGTWSGHGLELGDSGVSERESLALFGFPVSEPQMETNADGDMVLTQWFERARFEYHPDNPDGSRVLLGRLGAELAPSLAR